MGETARLCQDRSSKPPRAPRAQKEAEPSTPETPLQLSDHNALFVGRSAVNGTAIGLVAATGRKTMFGEIADRIPPETG